MVTTVDNMAATCRARGAVPGPSCPRCGSADTWTGGTAGWRCCTGCRRYWDTRDDPTA